MTQPVQKQKTPWWRGCVIYQIYPRSFRDSNGDGIGDLKGIYTELDHVARLGADAIWISPFMQSPMKDFGYDVSDYCAVDPVFGTMDDFKIVLDRAHELGLKVMIDQVWSHTSDQHAWFKESRQSRDNDKSDWYIWRDPKPDGTAPNNWLSYFGGPAWTWDARREQYYLHHFLKEQPSLNYWCPAVRQAIKDVAAFWLDMGVDGFRLDVAHAYVCDPDLRDNPARALNDPWPTDVPRSNPMARQRREHSMCVPQNIDWIEDLSAFINQWPERCLLGEAGGDDSERVAVSYTQAGKRFQLAYSFGLVGSAMSRADIMATVSRVEELLEDGWICWATSNHDFKRVASRLTGDAPLADKARLASTLGLSLRGSYCMYQGEELGLPQAELAFADLRDPYDIMLYPEHVGRDGCRTPMPWRRHAAQSGFTTAQTPWLPIPMEHQALAVDMQEGDPDSVLCYIREFLQWRRQQTALRTGAFTFIDVPEALIGFRRHDETQGFTFIFNPGHDSVSMALDPAINGAALLPFSTNAAVQDGKLTLKSYGYAIFADQNR